MSAFGLSFLEGWQKKTAAFDRCRFVSGRFD